MSFFYLWLWAFKRGNEIIIPMMWLHGQILLESLLQGKKLNMLASQVGGIVLCYMNILKISYYIKWTLRNTADLLFGKYWCCLPERRHGFTRVPAMPSFRDIAHDGVLCTCSNRSSPDRDKWCNPSGQAAWTVHHVQSKALLGHSPASQAGRRDGSGL